MDLSGIFIKTVESIYKFVFSIITFKFSVFRHFLKIVQWKNNDKKFVYLGFLAELHGTKLTLECPEAELIRCHIRQRHRIEETRVHHGRYHTDTRCNLARF